MIVLCFKMVNIGTNKVKYTVLRYSWWWTMDLSETCRVL